MYKNITSQSANLQQPIYSDFEKIAASAIQAEYAYETKLINDDDNMSTAEKIQNSRQSFFVSFACLIGLCVFTRVVLPNFEIVTEAK